MISLSSIGGGTWIEHELLIWSSHYVRAPCQHVEVFKQLLNMKNIVVVLDMNYTHLHNISLNTFESMAYAKHHKKLVNSP